MVRDTPNQTAHYGLTQGLNMHKSPRAQFNIPVHVVLVSLLVNQLFGLFLIFFGWPKKNCPDSGNFWSVSGNFWYTKKKFG